MLKSADTPYKDWDRRYRKGKKRVVTYVTPQVKLAMEMRADEDGVSLAEWIRRTIARELMWSDK